MRAHPIVTVVLAGGCLAAVLLSAYVGMPVVITVGLLVAVGVVAVLLWWLWLRRLPVARRSPAWAGRMGLVAVALAGLVTLLVIQLVPYGRSHSNPPATGEPQWADARTRELVVAACYSCHSNEVEYPAYASVAPISWMLEGHVAAARDEVNFSEFATDPGDAEESVEVVLEGEMPPPYFTRFGLHPEASLTEAERQELVDGLRRTPGLSDD
ncbi:heme-binding domain-containing protein [Dermatobacter hominis]|uniref:heme-binding domain-containing protein n=1 Tax=Dermatobacter hominis TaxID=2884263 RepID=UPI001D11A7E1|nr:heme-binding domain-containing protein [Dermatobacter hominis]UDY34124.1 heme-binding domain-containing protein [Dermatobacter hominis]